MRTSDGKPVVGFRRVRRYSAAGYPFEVAEPVVPYIPDLFLSSVIYLYPDAKTAKVNARLGGSGFLVSIESDTGEFIYAVSVKHVVKAKKNPAPAVRLNTVDGQADVLPLLSEWVDHPDGKTDICVAQVDIDPERFQFYALKVNDWFMGDEIPLSPTIREQEKGWADDAAHLQEMYETTGEQHWKDQLDSREGWRSYESTFGPGTETFYVGRYVHHDGINRNLPTVRFGNIAAMPSEPIAIRGMPPQVGYLMEARSLGGYSGSPVFASMQYMITEDGTVNAFLSGASCLIGVHCAQLDDPVPVRTKNAPNASTGMDVLQKTGMMVVIPIQKVREILDEGVLMMGRDKAKKDWDREQSTAGASPETADIEDGPDETPFTRDEFMGKLRKVTRPTQRPEQEG